MVCEKEKVLVPPVDSQSKCNEYGAEDYQSNDWYLEVIGTVFQRKARRCGGDSHRSVRDRYWNQDEKAQKMGAEERWPRSTFQQP